MGRILIVSNDMEIGGIQKSLIDFLKYLSGSKRYEIDLLMWQNDGVLRDQLPSKIKLLENHYPKTWREVLSEKIFTKKMKFFSQFVKFYFYNKLVGKPWLYYSKLKQKYDVVIAYSQNGYPRFFAIDNVSAKYKFLWYHHGSYNSTDRMCKLDKKYFGKFDKIVTVSEANKEMLFHHFPPFKNKLFVVPNIIDAEEIIEKANEKVEDFISEDGIVNFVTVSRFSKEKGIDLAVSTALELKRRGLKFRWYFIGDGETLPYIKKFIEDNNLQDDCCLLGSKKNPYPYMKLADLYIQTSFVESQSLTLYEALILNKFVIATNLPALREALQNEKLGVLCEPNSSDFAQKIEWVLQHHTVLKQGNNQNDKYEINNERSYRAIDELLSAQ